MKHVKNIAEEVRRRRPWTWRVFVPRNPRALLGIFKSLRHRNFAIFFAGMMVTFVGNWIQNIAVGWLVYNMTNSVFMLSAVVFAGQIPILVVTPFTGFVSDRFDKRKILITTQCLMMLQSLVLGLLTLTGNITIEAVFAISIIMGVIVSFDAPARQSFFTQLVPAEDLSNAIALNSTAVNASRFIGPAFGGVMIAQFGEAVCFLATAVGYFGLLGSLFAIRPKPLKIERSKLGPIGQIEEGFSYAAHDKAIRALLLSMIVFSLLALPFTMLLPAYAKGTLGGNSEVLGNLMSFMGVGAVSAALYLASRKSVLGLGRVLVVSEVVMGVSLVAISFTESDILAYLLCVPIGFGMIEVAAGTNTLLQSLVDDSKRGRVMSLYSMAFFGVPPVGSLVQGWISTYVPLAAVTAVCGGLCILSAVAFELYRPYISGYARKIYAQKGLIMPEIAEALRHSNRRHS